MQTKCFIRWADKPQKLTSSSTLLNFYYMTPC